MSPVLISSPPSLYALYGHRLQRCPPSPFLPRLPLENSFCVRLMKMNPKVGKKGLLVDDIECGNGLLSCCAGGTLWDRPLSITDSSVFFSLEIAHMCDPLPPLVSPTELSGVPRRDHPRGTNTPSQYRTFSLSFAIQAFIRTPSGSFVSLRL